MMWMRAFFSRTASFRLASGQTRLWDLASPSIFRGLAIGKLRGQVNSGHYPQVDEAAAEFGTLAKEIIKRAGL